MDEKNKLKKNLIKFYEKKIIKNTTFTHQNTKKILNLKLTIVI